MLMGVGWGCVCPHGKVGRQRWERRGVRPGIGDRPVPTDGGAQRHNGLDWEWLGRERDRGVEPLSPAWEAGARPLYQSRIQQASAF